MRRRIPNNNDYELGQKFDAALRQMMDKLSSDLQKTKSGELKIRAAIMAKKELLQLLTESVSHYMEKTDTQGQTVFNDIVKQYISMIDQACQVIQQTSANSAGKQDSGNKTTDRQLKDSQAEVQRL